MIDKIYFKFIRKLITRKEEHNQYSGGLWPRYVREAAAALCEGQTGRIAEVGCGEGLFLAKIAPSNPRADIYGVDLSEGLLDQAKARLTGHLHVHLVQGNALKTSFADGFLDRLFCINVIINLQRMQDVEQLFIEAHRTLKPGGTFVFDVRNSFSPIIQLQYRLARFYDTSIAVPLRSYSRFTVTKLLRKHHFTVTNLQYLGIPKNFFGPAILFTAKKL